MRGTTLNALIQKLRLELKIAESPALGKNTRGSHANALRSAQERLYSDWDWPFKNIYRDVTLAAGQRYYAPPADIELEGLRKVELFYSGQWYDIKRGICSEDYNIFNSDLDERCDPVLSWDVFNDPDGGDMIEAFPIPASNGALLRFHGTKKLSPLIADSDKADLDDDLLVLTAAVDFVNRADRQAAEAKAQRRYFTLRRNLSDNSTFINGGGVDPTESRPRRRPPQIVITPARTGG